jgi:hypothetical protein
MKLGQCKGCGRQNSHQVLAWEQFLLVFTVGTLITGLSCRGAVQPDHLHFGPNLDLGQRKDKQQPQPVVVLIL